MLNSLSMCDEWGGWESSGAPLPPPVSLSHGEFKKEAIDLSGSRLEGSRRRRPPLSRYLISLALHLHLCVRLPLFPSRPE